MASINTKSYAKTRTNEGAPASKTSKKEELRRAILACMLWEDNFYEDGVSIANRIANLVRDTNPDFVSDLAKEARGAMKLRHAPLLLARELARNNQKVREVLSEIIQRPDELAEFLAIYWADGKQPVSAQVKKGLADAFHKFDEYQLAKYNRDRDIKLKDVWRIVHPKPKNREEYELFGRLLNDNLKTPDTWETATTNSSDKKGEWERLLRNRKVGALALLRNLRNMQRYNVNETLIAEALKDMNAKKILPFRFIAASRFAPQFEPILEQKMFESLDGLIKLQGNVAVLVDVSGSMENPLSMNSDMRRVDAAEGLAMMLREVSDSCRVFSFSNEVVEIPARRGFALRDAIDNSQEHRGTQLGKAVSEVNRKVNPDLLIVVTDEQSRDPVGAPANRGYMVNVASYDRGVGYGQWNHITGFSEAIVRYISEFESEKYQGIID